MKFKRLVIILCIICIFFSNLCVVNIYADEEIKYKIRVNLAGNYVAVYDLNKSTMPIKIFACSAFGNNVQESIVYTIKGKEEWIKLADGTYSKNVSNLDEKLAITTVPYSEQKDDALMYEKFNELGDSYSGQNIWLNCANSKWIYENCPIGTEVEIYSDENAAEISIKPSSIKIPVNSESKIWDPSDDNAANPWKQKSVEIMGAHNLYVTKDSDFDILNGIKGYDTCGNDITDRIEIVGNYDLSKVGEYEVKYYLEDSIGSMKNVKIMIFVKENQEETIKATDGEIGEKEKSIKEKIKIIIYLSILSCGIAIMLVKYSKK